MSRLLRKLALQRLAANQVGERDRRRQLEVLVQVDEDTVVDGGWAEQLGLDSTPRTRTARAARALVRRLEPVVVLAPRWGAVERFLEDLSLDLAVGEPAVACRIAGFKALHGRARADYWQQGLHLVARLGEGAWRRGVPSGVADRRGFSWALDELIEEAHERAVHRTALLASGCENLPVEVLEDVVGAWRAYGDRHPEGRRCSVLLAANDTAPWLSVGPRQPLVLADYADGEAVAALVARSGPQPLRKLERAARFTGGIPGLVERVGESARATGSLPSRPEEIVETFGPLGDEIRGAVEIAASHVALAERMSHLMDGEASPYQHDVDRALVMAGLLRPIRTSRGLCVGLRAPAIAWFFR